MAASLSSKFASTYLKLLQGQSREAISPKEDHDTFYSNLLILNVDRAGLEAELRRLPKEVCLGALK